MIIKTQDIELIINAVYDNSVPQGLGFLHYKSGELPKEDLQKIADMYRNKGAVNLDYINGRACKCYITKHEQSIKVTISKDYWYDHTQVAIDNFIERLGDVEIIEE